MEPRPSATTRPEKDEVRAVAAPADRAAQNWFFTLEGEIPRRRLPLAYRVGLALSAVVMILLPLSYGGIIAATGYGVYQYAHSAYSFFAAQDNSLLMLVGYGGPLLAGALVILFMVKPLFAPSARIAAPAILDLEQQPQLRALIAAVCAKVGAPMPVRVEVDCAVNASARLRLGLLSLGRDDLVLTIGLPLAGRLSARQLAGVLAHELGHFAQGAGMSTTYVIRTVNGWLARLVFERDEWDESLAVWSRSLGFRLGGILWVTRGAIWLGRKILHGLMFVGHATACWQLRQMEFDADYYEIHVAGGEAFVATSRELRRLNLAGRAAISELREFWRDGRLVDDYPGYLIQRREHLADQIEKELALADDPPSTHWYDTHPSAAAREAVARASTQSGLFRGETSADVLFNHFGEICLEATVHHYREGLELVFEPAALLPTAVALRPGRAAAEAERALRQFTGAVLTLNRPVLWTEAEFQIRPSTHVPAELGRQFAEIRADLERSRAGAEMAGQKFNTLRDQWLLARVGRQFFEAKIHLDPAVFGLGSAELAPADARIHALEKELTEIPETLRAFEAAVHRWGMLVVGTAGLFSDSLPGDLAQRIQATQQQLLAFRPWLRAFPAWSTERACFALAVQHVRQLDAQHNYTLLGARVEKMRAIADNAAALVEGVAWPLAHAHAPRTAAQELGRLVEDAPPVQHLALLLGLIKEQYFYSIGQLLVQGTELERILAESELA